MRKVVRMTDPEVDKIIAHPWFPLEPKRLFYKVIGDGAWAGQRCFLIGGGPSLRGFKFDRLKGEKIIAINRAFEFCMHATILFSMDSRFYDWVIRDHIPASMARRRFYQFQGYKVFLDTGNYPFENVYYLKWSGRREGFTKSMTAGLCSGINSGYAALNLAYCLRANPIYLLGFDMQYDHLGSHFHTGYPTRDHEHRLKVFADYFNQIAPVLKEQGFKVYNLSPNSALECFEKKTADEVLQ